MCTRLGEVVPRSLDEGPFFRRRRSLRGAALRGVMCDKNVMFLLFFCSPKIDVRNKGISLPVAFFAFFGVISLVQENILMHLDLQSGPILRCVNMEP